MTGVPLGILLGTANVFVIGLGMRVMSGEAGVGVCVVMFGSVPGMFLGGLLGWLADVMKPLPTWARVVVLFVPAVLLVIVLGSYFELHDFILVSCIPTAVATLLLERRTRLVVVPPVPVARAQQPAPPTLRQLS